MDRFYLAFLLNINTSPTFLAISVVFFLLALSYDLELVNSFVCLLMCLPLCAPPSVSLVRLIKDFLKDLMLPFRCVFFLTAYQQSSMVFVLQAFDLAYLGYRSGSDSFSRDILVVGNNQGTN